MNDSSIFNETSPYISPPPKPDIDPIGLVDATAYANKCAECNGYARSCFIMAVYGAIMTFLAIVFIFLYYGS